MLSQGVLTYAHRGLSQSRAGVCVWLLASMYLGVVHDARAQSLDSDQSRFFATTTGSATISKGFYQHGSARTVFAEPVSEQAASSIEFFPRKLVLDDSAEEQAGALPSSDSKGVKERIEADRQELAEESPQSPEEMREVLLKKFGNPAKEAPVEAQETAPMPFRGMMAALETGDEDLARSYARQYVRYMNRLQQRTSRVVGLVGTAMEREGIMERGAWPASAVLERDREAFDQEIAAAEGAELSLDDRAAALLRDAKNVEEESSPAPAPAVLAPSRDEIRRSLHGKVPVDAGSKVEILFFFKPHDSQSQAMARELQVLYQTALKLGGRSITAIPLTEITPKEEKHFQARTGITFPINPAGSSLAQLMDIRSTPTTALMSPRISKAFLVNGLRPSGYVGEVLNMMEGR